MLNSFTHKETYLFFTGAAYQIGEIEYKSLSQCQRYSKQKLKFPIVKFYKNISHELNRRKFSGAIIELNRGVLSGNEILVTKKLLNKKIETWFYWSKEQVFEKIDYTYLNSYWRIWAFNKAYVLARKFKILFSRELHGLFAITKDIQERAKQKLELEVELETILASTKTILCDSLENAVGVYLRMDVCEKLNACGSYGHTCYVAKELKKRCRDFYAIVTNEYDLLTKFDIKQVVLGDLEDKTEEGMLRTNNKYYLALKTALKIIKPQFIYERIVLGNYLGAKLSQELNIPYVVEYNGSEIVLKHSFQGEGYRYEALYSEIELAAFKQAAIINVISEVVAEDLIGRGIPKEKILINPNGADPQRYYPLDKERQKPIREKLNLVEEDIIVGFIGTFGGWHGIDVLVKIIPEVCERNSKVKFLLIGDGSFRHLIDEMFAKYFCQDRVICTGLIPQDEAVELLQACDIYISPHASHMKNCLFFGSPTKLFEYMALGRAIVAADLSQIGQVLTPAVFAKDLFHQVEVASKRAILCEPGNVDEFVHAILFLAKNRDISEQLGKNAREAAISIYNWEQYVERLWRVMQGEKVVDNVVKEVVSENWLIKESIPPIGPRNFQRQAMINNNLKLGTPRVSIPWMLEPIEFTHCAGKKVLGIGVDIWGDLVQFAQQGAIVSHFDSSRNDLSYAESKFNLMKLPGEFYHGEIKRMPFSDASFSMICSSSAFGYSEDIEDIVREIHRVLKPGGKAIIMAYAENSLFYWRDLVIQRWMRSGLSQHFSLGRVVSYTLERDFKKVKPTINVYTRNKLKRLFADFELESIRKRQVQELELPHYFRFIPSRFLERILGWNWVIKVKKPLQC